MKSTNPYDVRSIIQSTTPISQASEVIRKIGESIGNTEFQTAAKSFKSTYVDGYLRNDLVCFIEYPYNDKSYRDAYYNYHSTKTYHYEKNCIRIAFFDASIDGDAFKNNTLHVECQQNNNFLGCITIRPTSLNPFGRSMLSPKITDISGSHLILRKFDFMINGSMLSVEAFPNSGQDGEYHSCAETSLLNILSYFSKYSNFNELLPSNIIHYIDSIRNERVTPTVGLRAEEISYVLKKCGFGVKMYKRQNHAGTLLKKTLNDYVESGIPVIVILERHNEYHAAIAIGHNEVNYNSKKIVHHPSDHKTILDSFEWYDKQYVFINDNFPSYQVSTFERPGGYYKNDFQNANIYAIIVPLDKKIYLDSIRVRETFAKIFEQTKEGNFVYQTHFLLQRISLDDTNPFLSRYFLTTNNSFKKTICGNPELGLAVKKFVQQLNLPKFVWLIELVTVASYQKKRSLGFLIVDSTSSVRIESILAIIWKGVIKLGTETGKEKSIDEIDFPLYSNNLYQV